MKNTITFFFCCLSFFSYAQGPSVTSWLQNTTETGTYYVSGNSTALENGILYNCQLVEYSDDFVYVHATGIPSYPTGPFQDGNPSQAQNQEAIYQIPRFPQENTGRKDETTGGNIGIFINGVSLFDYRDGVGWNPNTNALCGGPGNPPCPGGPNGNTDWRRDAVPAEKPGFDCSKAHPAMGNYHHHQNPSAFKLDIDVVSDICNLYDADGLYTLDSTKHSPLIGYAYDGFPIYGSYGFANADGSGEITLIKSGYQLRNITQRTTHADGSAVSSGPDVDDTYFLGYFREDYEWLAHTEERYLDIHNGRFCVTPEYPNGTYAYFATVDDNWNSTYPYIVGPTYYGSAERRSVDAVNEATTVYTGSTSTSDVDLGLSDITIFPNPATDLIAVQINDLLTVDLAISLISMEGKVIQQKVIEKGSTIAFFNVETLYNGIYIVKVGNGAKGYSKQILVER